MTYTLSIPVVLGSAYAGLTLEAQLVNTAGSNVGAAVTSGFVAVGGGNYLWTYASVPDGHRGGVKFNVSPGGALMAFTAVNPEDAEDAALTLALVDTEVAAILAAVDTEVAAIKARTDLIPATPAAVGSAMTLDMTQSVADVGGAANTLGGVLALLRAMANGKLTIVSGVLKMFGQNGTTQVGIDRTVSGTVPTDTARQ